jgi:hypothetical protein
MSVVPATPRRLKTFRDIIDALPEHMTGQVIAGRCQSTWMTVDLQHDYEQAAALDQAMRERGIW